MKNIKRKILSKDIGRYFQPSLKQCLKAAFSYCLILYHKACFSFRLCQRLKFLLTFRSAWVCYITVRNILNVLFCRREELGMQLAKHSLNRAWDWHSVIREVISGRSKSSMPWGKSCTHPVHQTTYSDARPGIAGFCVHYAYWYEFMKRQVCVTDNLGAPRMSKFYTFYGRSCS